MADFLRRRLVHVIESREDFANHILRFRYGNVRRDFLQAEISLAAGLHVKAQTAEQLLILRYERGFPRIERQDRMHEKLL